LAPEGFVEFLDTRYNRQTLLPQVGTAGQARLSDAHVAVIGAGGVKSPLILYLAAAGIGHLTIIDFDRVELSNLNRQILFSEADIGRSKAVVAGEHVRALNSDIEVECVDRRVNSSNIAELLGSADVVVEGGDSTEGRLLVNSHCLATGQPMVHASAQYNYGYVLTVLPHLTACFGCVFPDLPSRHGGSVPVIGTATGVAGVLGASEVIKLVLGRGRLIVDGMLVFSLFEADFTFVPTARDPNCSSCAAL